MWLNIGGTEGDMDYLAENDTFMFNETIAEKCGSMSSDKYVSFMTCAFWMEGVLLVVTGNSVKIILLQCGYIVTVLYVINSTKEL